MLVKFLEKKVRKNQNIKQKKKKLNCKKNEPNERSKVAALQKTVPQKVPPYKEKEPPYKKRNIAEIHNSLPITDL